jgi:limonene-1,2-epoxide hydrolase
MGARQEEVALQFIGYFRDTWPENLDDPLRLVTEDCYYQSIVPTTAPIRGKAAIKEKWEKIKELYGDQRHDMKGVGSSDRLVFTERIDWSFTNGKWVSIPLVAVFEVNEDAKICAWREYLDALNVSRQSGVDIHELAKSLSPD